MLGGVCGGLGESFSVDPNLLRIAFTVLAVAPGIGIPAYVLLWILLPEAARAEEATPDDVAPRTPPGQGVGQDATGGPQTRGQVGARAAQAPLAAGLALIGVGIVFLMRNLGFSWIDRMIMMWAGPALLIAGGLGLRWRWFRTQGS